jgi:hypothetical protein
MPVKEIRDWIQFGFLVIGGIMGLFAFRQNLNQRRLENALKLVASFRESLGTEGLTPWQALLAKTSGTLRLLPGKYLGGNDEQRSLLEYFSENSPDNHAVQRITENLEVVCYEVCNGTVDARYVWFELGQILTSIHYWTSHTYESKNPLEDNNGGKLTDTRYPSIHKMFNQYAPKFKAWPTKRYEFARLA